MMANEVLGGVLTLAVRHVSRILEYSGSRSASSLTMCSGILHPDQERVRDLSELGRNPVAPYVTDDHRTISESKL